MLARQARHFLVLIFSWMGQHGVNLMRKIGRILASAVIVALLGMVSIPALSQSTVPTPYKRAPGPIVGAGLPVLAVGLGVYWLIRRRRKA